MMINLCRFITECSSYQEKFKKKMKFLIRHLKDFHFNFSTLINIPNVAVSKQSENMDNYGHTKFIFWLGLK